jgi:hypothetical protein
MEEPRSRQVLFIKRERVRRNLIRTKPGETICLQFEEVELLLKWIKELEEQAKIQDERRSKYGFKKV